MNYPDLTSIQDFQKRIEDRVTQIPGVQSVAATSDNPLVSGFKDSFRISGQPVATAADRQLVAQASVSPGFFATMGIPMRSGREFTSLDRPQTERVLWRRGVSPSKTLTDPFIPTRFVRNSSVSECTNCRYPHGRAPRLVI
jgi:hypothetical protein